MPDARLLHQAFVQLTLRYMSYAWLASAGGGDFDF
jgi:hypothetical protein